VPWRSRWATELGGPIVNLAIHAHDLVYYVLGPARSVTAHLTTRVNPIETEDCGAVSLEMADGSLCTLAVTTGSSHEIIREALAAFTPQPEGYAGQFSRYHEALQSDGELPVTLADARASLELITAIYHAARTRRPVRLPLDGDHPLYRGWRPAQRSARARPAPRVGRARRRRRTT
jgi:predicted dehydrogenase